MSDYYKYKRKSQELYYHQLEFVRQTCEAKRDGRRITVRTPKQLDRYLGKNISDLVVKLLAEHFAKGRSIFSDLTDEELREQINNIEAIK